MNNHLKFRQPTNDEITRLKDFPPKSWNSDLAQVVKFHYGQAYFHVVVAVANDTVVGVGNCMINGSTGWLGNIIVLPEYRGQGYGRSITEYLIEHIKSFGCLTQLLVATDMGEPLYAKLGFTVESYYQFFTDGPQINFPANGAVRELATADIPTLLKLDKGISGENRAALLLRYISAGWVSTKLGTGEINGFYLPDFASGLIVATEKNAGVNLLRVKLSKNPASVVIPEDNEAAGRFLEAQGFQKGQRVPRMIFGSSLAWKPEGIYCRASGYSG